MSARSKKISFVGAQGDELAALLDLPAGPVRAYAIFAHCFTCSKDVFAAARISGALAELGIGVLRFDFTGLGASGGEFANTNFSSNVADLLSAVAFMRQNFEAPKILIGHSLGGAAILAAAGEVPEAKAVATIGAPADARHVTRGFQADLTRIEQDGEAEVELGGRRFQIRKQFIDDLDEHDLGKRIADLRKPLLILHAPRDEVVGIENAGKIFDAARHPKSFVSLDDADHLLTRRRDALYVAEVLAAWAGRYIGREEAEREEPAGNAVVVSETGLGKFQQRVTAGPHRLTADEPEAQGGLDSGPSPYDFLAIALGACTSMTLRMYADRKGLELGPVSVTVDHKRVHARDCTECAEGRDGYVDRFERTIRIEGGVAAELSGKLAEIAGKCPVHRTLESSSVVVTKIAGED
ncbi:MAG: bifunctional alpha/beta hydrolase/OsmC family protein [Parvibaculum sp.]|uniref:bifunctional alpha/beta hydrolase/OsmC family protein n=1 Tax=Parvibaculum sp. TaxID=2024848 RepID=UPI002ABB3851|nr:bifunctional alpha/beta hydrolase/OsmC family protein [Parvibaculum sp.]MDZ4380973.1 bifunctional alpha/beta hydrolase/OsmC family protein [Parvibaculum sp.]